MTPEEFNQFLQDLTNVCKRYNLDNDVVISGIQANDEKVIDKIQLDFIKSIEINNV